MKRRLVLLFLTLIVNITFSQNKTHPSEWYVINKLGAKVYEQASFKSKVVTVLKTGAVLNAESYLETKDVYKIKDDFGLIGKWVKTKVKGINGFVFSSDLTNQKLDFKKAQEGQIYFNLLGNLISEKSSRVNVKTKNGVFPKIIKTKIYKNGIETEIAWDGCFNHKTEYRKFKFNEVYHQMVNDYIIVEDKGKFLIPVFDGKSGNVFKFSVEIGLTEDLKIEVKENDLIIISSYDCD
nr:hypothetical protein [uncultured Flavobacterium sp.]